jgi:acyl-coenzyme A synthetase/AMP-(fatty) acid ligase
LPWQTEAFGLKESDRYGLLSGLGYNHLHRDLFTALALGATLCVPSDDDLKDPSRLARWLDRHEVSILHLTPALGRFLQTAGGHALAAVRRVFFGGDLLLRQDILGMRALAPNAQFTSFYGATETQRAVGYFNLPDSPLDARNRARQALPSGKGAPNVQLLLLTPNGQLAGIGEIGELYVRSPHLAAGYVGDGSPGEVNFITNPFTGNPRDRLYRTRELARYLPDGSVEWLGRKRRRASIRGFRVELAEVESALRQCSGVRQAAVMAEEFPLDEPSRKEARLVAYVALDKDGANDASRLREWVSGKLPSYMVPSYFRFVERMPLNPSGKIDYDLLPQAGQPLARAESFIEEPRSELERAVGKIFAEVLQIERIGRQDDFFALGGHSLLAARAAARLRQSLGLELDLRDFLELPTVEAICRRMEAQRKASQSGDRLQGEQEREEIEL